MPTSRPHCATPGTNAPLTHAHHGARRLASALTYGAVLAALAIAPAFALTEAEFLDKVLAQDKLLEEARIGLDIKHIELNASRDNYADWKVDLSADVGYRRRDDRQDGRGRSVSTYSKITKTAPWGVDLDVEKRFLSNPASVTFGLSHGRDESRQTRYKRDSGSRVGAGYYKGERALHKRETDAYVQFKYPLLKHDSNAASLKTHHRDIIDFKRQQLLFYETKEDFVNDRMNDYLAWVLYQRQAVVNRHLLDEFRRLDTHDDIEAAILKSAIYQIEDDNQDTQTKLLAIKRRLAVLLDDEHIVTATPQFDLQKRVDFVDGDMSAYLQDHNRTLRRIALNQALSEIEIAYFQNQRLPAVNLALRAERRLDEGNTTETSFYDDDETEYFAGITFSYPLGGNTSNRANLKKSQLGVRRLEISYAEKQQDILADIQLLNALLTVDEARLLAAIDAAQRSTRIEYDHYQSGQSSFRDLLQAYQEERAAKLNHIDDVIDYQVNSLEYDNLLDRLIDTPCKTGLVDCLL